MYWPEITKEIPLEEIKRIHQQIWQYVVETGRKPITPYYADCVACEYDNKMKGGMCRNCPILWGGQFNDCMAIGSEYRHWEHSICLDEYKERAKAVRDAKFKFELEENNNERIYKRI